ncbi:polyphosphate polymerase domain-containing protein [Paenibacillus beijingensis]|uniref:Vacuolar transporter n=1 Tax=Paenibacillus beijingensis TaxID=1126833 RepID=A0A0D5NI57_9BACL|nr:polyphosphate polymerase domain-containing protein [Paenibacillus beijingensis]AJY75074.1 vacuolar transporter [Paenibacillus beijingensis]
MEFMGRKLRHELKYFLHIHEYLTIRQRISAVLPLDSNSRSPEGYNIRSLYFDGPQDHALYDKNDGIFGRRKYRIRIYNEDDSIIRLERKSKYGDYVNKEGATLTRDAYVKLLEGDASLLRHEEHPLLRDFYMEITQRGFRPAAIVDYIREAYVYPYGNVRITFDKKLSAGIGSFDLFSPHLVLREALDTSRTILEVKYDRYLPDAIRSLAAPSTSNRSAISKYVICREAAMLHFKP